mgnify:CR=1 FL=1
MPHIEFKNDCREVTNLNAPNMCIHETCSKIYTTFYHVVIGKDLFYFPVCNIHADLIEQELKK